MSDIKSDITLVRELCPICAKEVEESEYTSAPTFHKDPCPACKELKTKGFVLIGAVEKKTKDVTNPYRSGNIWVLPASEAMKIFTEGLPISGVGFVDVEVAQQVGLPNVNMNA